MNSKEQIEVHISPEGQIRIDAVGYTGKSCEEATRFLEDGLGVVATRKRTRDRNRNNRNQNDNQQKQKT